MLRYFILPRKMSLATFAKSINMSRFRLGYFLKGQSFSIPSIFKLSAATYTSPRLWIDIQTEWEFAQFLNIRQRISRGAIRPIEPIVPLKHHDVNSPGEILLTKFIKPFDITISTLARRAKIDKYGLRDIVHGKTRISPPVAAKLGAAFGTGTKYWLDIQSRHEIQQVLKSNIINKVTSVSAGDYFSAIPTSRSVGRNPISIKINQHPGIILNEIYIKPSELTSKDWSRLFCMTKKAFIQILLGKKEMPLTMMVQLSRLFKGSSLHWIELQNSHYAANAEKNLQLELKKIDQIRKPLFDKRETFLPVDHLIDNFLRPMNWTLAGFSKWIKVNPPRLYNVMKGVNRIDFDLAIRIGEALNMDPMYWIRLQAEHDIVQFESKLEKQNLI